MDKNRLTYEFNCAICGDCCLLNIPVTIHDVHEIAKELGITDEEAFKGLIRIKLTPKSRSLQLRKKDSGTCFFLSHDKKCMIYRSRPSICRFFHCTMHSRVIMKRLTSGDVPPHLVKRFERHKHATRLTEEYTVKNGSQWNQRDFEKALREFKNSAPKETAL